MKRIISLALAVLMIAGLFATITFTASAEPDGVAIHNADEFLAMDAAGSYYLANDITVTTTYSTPFTGTLDGNGKTVTAEVPLFAKAGGEIFNLTIGATIGEKTSVVASGYGGALAVEGTTGSFHGIVNNNNVAGGTSSGGIFGYIKDVSKGYIEIYDCVNNGDITGSGQTGGIVGYAQGRIIDVTDCVNNGTITATASYAGGIFGRFGLDKAETALHQVTFDGCVNNGDVSGTKGNCGGIVGYTVGQINAYDCVNNGDVNNYTGTDNSYAGGILGCPGGTASSAVKTYTGDGSKKEFAVDTNPGAIDYVKLGGTKTTSGYSYDASTNKLTFTTAPAKDVKIEIFCNTLNGVNIEYCYNYGNITSNYDAGGICSKLGSNTNCAIYKVLGCGNYGTVTTTKAGGGTSGVGGIAAYVYGESTIIDCFNVGTIRCTGTQVADHYIGGIFGYNNNKQTIIANCYSAGALESAPENTKAIIYPLFFEKNGAADVYNCWALADAGSVTYRLGDGASYDVKGDVFTAADLASGKLCYDIARGGGNYFQTIGTDDFPITDKASGIVYKNGTGYFNSEDTFEVATAEEFYAMSGNGRYKLTADITLDKTYDGFAGTFDGQDHTVTIGAPMFDRFAGTAMNFTTEGEIIANDYLYVAAVAGRVVGKEGNFANITNNADITNNTNSSCGGIVAAAGVIDSGVSTCTADTVYIVDCVNNGDIFSTTNYQTGGIGGWFWRCELYIVGCVNNGNIGSTTGYCGGILCRWDSIKKDPLRFDCLIMDCVNNGNVTSARDQAGGMMSYSENGSVHFLNCENNGKIMVTPWDKSNNCFTDGTSYTSSKAGGILGLTGATNCSAAVILGCINRGEIFATYRVGGILGGAANAANTTYCENTRIESCVNYGYVHGKATAKLTSTAGGIAGYFYGSANNGISFCVNYGDVYYENDVSGSILYTAGLVGYFSATDLDIKNCISVGNVSNKTAAGTDRAMKLYWNNGGPCTATRIFNNWIPEGTTIQVENNKGVATDVKTFTEEDLTSGKLCYELNAASDEDDSYLCQVIGKDITTAYSYVPEVKYNADLDIYFNLTDVTGAAIRLMDTAEESGLRFKTEISLATYDELVKTYGADKVSIGTLIAPTSYVDAAESFTKEGLDKLGHPVNYLDVKAYDFFEVDEEAGIAVIAGSIKAIKPEHYDLAFSAIGYFEVDTGSEIVTVYSDYDDLFNSRSVSEIAEIILEYDAGSYTEAELAIIRVFAGE